MEAISYLPLWVLLIKFFKSFVLSNSWQTIVHRKNLVHIMFLYSLQSRNGIYILKVKEKTKKNVDADCMWPEKHKICTCLALYRKSLPTSFLLHCFCFLQVLPPCFCFVGIVLVSVFHITDILWISGEDSMHLFKSKALKCWLVALCTWVGLIGWEALQ